MRRFTTALKAALIMVIIFGARTNESRAQQIPLYSEYMFNTFEINPAYAGARESVQITSMFRKQWTGFKTAPQSIFLSADMGIPDKRIGLGVKVVDDRDEITRTFGGQAAYSFKIPTGDYSTLALGLQAGAMTFKSDFTKVDVIDPNDPSFSQIVNTVKLNFGTGIFFNTEYFYAGLSVPNLVRHNLSHDASSSTFTDLRQNMHLYFNTGYVFSLSTDLMLRPSMLVRATVGSPLSYDLNANLWIADILSVGGSYRNKSAAVALMSLKITPELTVGYAYDHSISQLAIIAKGSHELMLRYEIATGRKSLSPRYF